MKAMQYQGYGDPSQMVLAEIAPPPRPGPTQILVKVLATSVNPVDWKLHNGSYRYLMPIKFPSVPGFDFAGEAWEVGSQVKRFKLADRVYGMSDHRPGGAAAEYLTVGEAAVAHMPSNLTPEEAATIPLAGLTALQGLRDLGQIRAGHRALIIGASGGVGHLAVQIAKAYGARVIGVCSTQHLEMVRALGADRAVDYTKEPDYLTTGPYDLILDLVVHQPLRALLGALAPGAVYVSSLPSFSRVAAAFLLPLLSKKRVRMIAVKPRGEDLEELRRLCEAGKLRPVIDKCFPLEQLNAAHAYSEEGRTAGKIAIAVGHHRSLQHRSDSPGPRLLCRSEGRALRHVRAPQIQSHSG